MSRYISRSTFLKAVLGVAAGATAARCLVDGQGADRVRFPCRMLGPDRTLGHKIRNGSYAGTTSDNHSKTADTPEKKKIVIVGGGIAGLSAGWWLKKNGVNDFVLLELEKEPGGNSRCGKNAVSGYPWGAHYVPLPNVESKYVRMFFEERGIIERYDESGQPVYNELYLCHEPQDRLFKDGVFSEGLVPKRGLQPTDKEQIARFFTAVDDFRKAQGSDGKQAFAIPLDYSSSDKAWRDLDKISMAQWLQQNHFDSEPLVWYVNYCCRDDYGAACADVSAWAGIHYFAGRKGTASNAEMNWVLTWPEGNGFIVNELRNILLPHVRTNNAVTTIRSQDHSLTVESVTDNGLVNQWSTEFVVFGAPRFIAPYIIDGYNKRFVSHEAMTYSPWLVANITLREVPKGRGAELAWDNVSYRSPSLGYVVANHQDITTRRGPIVVTYYYPYSDQPPKIARQTLQTKSASSLANEIVKDLEKMHPGINEEIVSMDLWPWGHGMIRPSPGYIWGADRQRLLQDHNNIIFAHSDMSGISNFEEAQFRGVEAAKKILAKIGSATG